MLSRTSVAKNWIYSEYLFFWMCLISNGDFPCTSSHNTEYNTSICLAKRKNSLVSFFNAALKWPIQWHCVASTVRSIQSHLRKWTSLLICVGKIWRNFPTSFTYSSLEGKLLQYDLSNMVNSSCRNSKNCANSASLRTTAWKQITNKYSGIPERSSLEMLNCVYNIRWNRKIV